MPFSGEPKLNAGTPEDPDSGYRSRFNHEEETVTPGFYSVHLKDYNIQAELTATTRAGFHSYTFASYIYPKWLIKNTYTHMLSPQIAFPF